MKFATPFEDVLAAAAPITSRDHARGPAGAPVTLLEYGDYECPYCRVAHGVVKRLRADLDGRVRFVFRHFPLTQVHPQAMMAASAAEAADRQGKFWAMHDILYERQQLLEPDAIAEWAAELNLDLRRFADDMGRAQISQRILEDRRSGIRAGVNGTPTFFIQGVRYAGPPDYGALLGAIEGVLA